MATKNSRFKKRSRQKKSLKAIIFGGLFFCFLAVAAYFLVWSPYFWVSRIEFESAQSARYYTPDEIKKIVQNVLDEKIWSFISRKSIFLVATGNIIGAILSQYPEIKSVRLDKGLPNAITLTIKERAGVGVWCQLEERIAKGPVNQEAISTSSESVSDALPERKIGQCFNIAREGTIYHESALVEGGFVLNIFSSRIAEPKIGTQVASPEIMNFILALKSGLSEIKTVNKAALSAVNFEIVSERDLRAKTLIGLGIYFNPSYSVETQLNALRLVLDSEIKENYVSLEYLDLRIEGRVYYK